MWNDDAGCCGGSGGRSAAANLSLVLTRVNGVRRVFMLVISEMGPIGAAATSEGCGEV